MVNKQRLDNSGMVCQQELPQLVMSVVVEQIQEKENNKNFILYTHKKWMCVCCFSLFMYLGI